MASLNIPYLKIKQGTHLWEITSGEINQQGSLINCTRNQCQQHDIDG
jgi:hypothetical protein